MSKPLSRKDAKVGLWTWMLMFEDENGVLFPVHDFSGKTKSHGDADAHLQTWYPVKIISLEHQNYTVELPAGAIYTWNVAGSEKPNYKGHNFTYVTALDCPAPSLFRLPNNAFHIEKFTTKRFAQDRLMEYLARKGNKDLSKPVTTSVKTEPLLLDRCTCGMASIGSPAHRPYCDLERAKK